MASLGQSRPAGITIVGAARTGGRLLRKTQIESARFQGDLLLIGILSDTHDHADIMAKGVELLRARGAEYYIHCGDVGGQRVIDCLAGLPSAFVWGNNDWDRPALQRYAKNLGIACYGAGADIRLAEKRFAIIHGDDLIAYRRIVDGQQFDYLLYGHTHVKSLERKGKTLLINPGALYRAREKTVALLQTTTDEVEFLTVEPIKP